MIILDEGGLKASESKQSLALTVTSGLSKQDSYTFDDGSSVSEGSSMRPPPRYLERQLKTQITYDFIPQTNPANSMIICPPNFLKHDSPTYYVTVNMNVFTPFSYITTIKRDSWDGEVVGDFEMAISGLRRASTVCLRGYECPIDEMLEVNTKVFRGGTTYLWKSKKEKGFETSDLYWEEGSFAATSVLSCYFGKEKTVINLLAKLMPSTLPRRPGRPISYTRMDVTPKGHDFLDEIIVSMLIVERMRTAPSALKDLPTSMLKELF